MANSYLQHHGIRGMRWGVRRFQNKDGSLTNAGKKRYGDSDGEDSSKETKESYEEGKQKALKSGNATEVLKYKGDLTPQEMQSALSRINWERSMQDISNKELAEHKSKAEEVFKKIDTYTTRVNTAAKAWNTFANVYNAFSGTDKVSLPKIDTNITGGNKGERKNEKKEKKKAEDAQKKRQEQEAQKDSTRKERAEKKAKKEAEEKNKTDKTDDKVYEGDVVDGVSKKTKKEKPQKEKIIDVDWEDVPMSEVKQNSSYALGERYIAGLLEKPKK